MTSSTEASAPANVGRMARFLRVVEALGNALPHPVTLFALFCLFIILLSGPARLARRIGGRSSARRRQRSRTQWSNRSRQPDECRRFPSHRFEPRHQLHELRAAWHGARRVARCRRCRAFGSADRVDPQHGVEGQSAYGHRRHRVRRGIVEHRVRNGLRGADSARRHRLFSRLAGIRSRALPPPSPVYPAATAPIFCWARSIRCSRASLRKPRV